MIKNASNTGVNANCLRAGKNLEQTGNGRNSVPRMKRLAETVSRNGIGFLGKSTRK